MRVTGMTADALAGMALDDPDRETIESWRRRERSVATSRRADRTTLAAGAARQRSMSQSDAGLA